MAQRASASGSLASLGCRVCTVGDLMLAVSSGIADLERAAADVSALLRREAAVQAATFLSLLVCCEPVCFVFSGAAPGPHCCARKCCCCRGKGASGQACASFLRGAHSCGKKGKWGWLERLRPGQTAAKKNPKDLQKLAKAHKTSLEVRVCATVCTTHPRQ